MKINEVIRTRRQALHLTQEGLADRLGVSAPAVNKWERGLNYPDITILPALARTLGVDLNTLLSFQEDMSREETAQFLRRLTGTAREEGCAAAFRLARDKLWEYPNNDQLAFAAAGVLEGVLTLYPEGGEEERAVWEQQVHSLYERAIHSGDPEVREQAVCAAAARSISREELDRGEELLGRLSSAHRDKRVLTASLRERQDRREEAWTLLEQELLAQGAAVQAALLQMTCLALKEGDQERLRAFSRASEEAGEALCLPGVLTLSVSLQKALEEQDPDQALALLDRLLDSAARPWQPNGSPLYSHLSPKEERGEPPLFRYLLNGLETGPETRFLKERPEFWAILEKYRKISW